MSNIQNGFNAADGSLRLSTPNSGLHETFLPISMTLSIQTGSENVNETGDGAKTIKNDAEDNDADEAGGVLTLIHVQRSKRQFYRLNLETCSIRWTDAIRMKVVTEVIQRGLEAVDKRRPKKILVSCVLCRVKSAKY